MVLSLVLLCHFVHHLDGIIERMPSLITPAMTLTIHSHHSIMTTDETNGKCPTTEDIPNLIGRS